MSLNNVKHILLVLSGKGGVGKSSVTTQIALSLSLAGKSVGILDIDLTGPSIPRLLGLEDAKITQAPGGWNPVQVHAAQILPPLPTSPENPSLDAHGDHESARSGDHVQEQNGSNPPPRNPSTASIQIGSLYATSLAFLLPSRSSAVIWRGPKKTAMVRQFLTDVLWPPLDYLLIDTPPGTSDEHISLVETLLQNTSTSPISNQLAGAIVVTTPQAVATADVRKEINFCGKVGVGVVGVVENMSGFVCECCGERTNLFGKGGGEVMSLEFGVPFLGSVPLDLGWGVVVEEGGWARYGEVEPTAAQGGDGGEGEGLNGEPRVDSVDGPGVTQDDGRARRKEDGASLVQRYRSCILSNVFDGITRQIVGIVEGDHEAR